MSEDDMKAFVRGECDYLQARMHEIEHVIPVEEQKRLVTLTRDCMTYSKKHYPKTEQLYAEWQRANVRDKVAQIITARDTGGVVPYWASDLLLDVLRFPQRFHDNYDDMFGEHFKTWDTFLSEHIERERTEHLGSDRYVVELSEDIEKRLRKEYEREKKEWEKNQHGD